MTTPSETWKTPASWVEDPAPSFVYHATNKNAAQDIARNGIRAVVNAWGPAGGRLGNGFYTHEDPVSSAVYCGEEPIVVLKFQVASGLTGKKSPVDESFWLGDLDKDEYEAINDGIPFLSFAESSGREIKFNDAGKLQLVGVSQNSTATVMAANDDASATLEPFVAPADWLNG
ncbi:hypothetical protein ACGFX8_36420 [Streptomyces sp. NPDC048362]|uniref:hypothetical protein n=1 Tax=Streptomyces sp. NPDC048362 TaxID=3365539 RepID=UPI003719910C